MQIIRQTDLVEQPWKNGGGITRDIAAHREGETLLWRLSMADVDGDGPFSTFAGLTRVLTVIRGSGMVLHSPESDLPADYACPVTFDGATPITASLTSGSIRDFNLMYATAKLDGTAECLHGPAHDTIGAPDQTVVIHCITGQIDLTDDDLTDGDLTDGGRLVAGDTAISTDQAVAISLTPDSIALCITLTQQAE